MTHTELLILSTVLLIIVIGTGYRSYIAWFRPAAHQEFLEKHGNILRGLPLGAYQFYTSQFNFWLMRIMYSLAFFLSTAVLGLLLNLLLT